MKTIEDVLVEYRKAKSAGSVDCSLAPLNTRVALKMAANQARTKAEKLEEEYRTLLFSKAFGLAVDGPTAKVAAFLDAVGQSEAIEVLVYDAADVYVTMAKQLEKVMGKRREFDSNVLLSLYALVRQVAQELNYREPLTAAKLNALKTVPDFTALVDLVRSHVNRAAPGLVAAVAKDVLGNQGIQFGHIQTPTLIVFTNLSSEDVKELSTIASLKKLSLKDDTEVTAEFVIDILKKLKKQPVKKN